MADNLLLVKNMLCHRCILAVESILNSLFIDYQQVHTGEIYLEKKLIPEQYDELTTQLHKIGLELIDDKRSSLVEKIKQLARSKARNEVNEQESNIKLSVYLSQQLHHEYTYLSSYFSSSEKRTIEQYFIEQRIEKVKELLVYNEMTLSEISFEMDYSSVAHLSYQFKQVAGLTASDYRKENVRRLKLP